MMVVIAASVGQVTFISDYLRHKDTAKEFPEWASTF